MERDSSDSYSRANFQSIWAAASACLGLQVPSISDSVGHAGYKCYVFVAPEQLKSGWSRGAIQQAIVERGGALLQRFLL